MARTEVNEMTWRTLSKLLLEDGCSGLPSPFCLFWTSPFDAHCREVSFQSMVSGKSRDPCAHQVSDSAGAQAAAEGGGLFPARAVQHRLLAYMVLFCISFICLSEYFVIVPCWL